MGRSERYIPPSEEELRRLHELSEKRKEFHELRAKVIRASLGKIKKADLVELIVQLAQENKRTLWLLESSCELNKPLDLLVHDIEEAIKIATKVEHRRENENFHYDSFAYEAVSLGFSKLIELGEIEKAKKLSLVLVEKASYQISCSDEGLMLGEIQDCLRIVINAAKGTPDCESWALEMLCCDSIGCICKEELTAMAGKSAR